MAEQEIKQARRPLREGEALCRYNCGTIVKKEVGDCEMCCPAAVAARVKRVAPLEAAAKKRNEKETAARKARSAK